MIAAAVLTGLLGQLAAPAGQAFGPGEQTVYEVSWLGITAGRAEVTVGWPVEKFGRTVWPLVCFGRTVSVGAIYRVRDRFTSYWDPVAQRPVGSDFFVDEQTEHRRERYRYDGEALQVFATKQREGLAPYDASYGIPGPETMDLASAGFSLRNLPLVVGLEREVPVFTGHKVYVMSVRVQAREQLLTRLGALEVFRVTVNGDFTGKLATKGLITLFYTADGRALPVRAEAELVLGTVALDVVSYEPGRSGE
jgi:hypothetical protein